MTAAQALPTAPTSTATAAAAAALQPGYGGFHIQGMALALPMAALREVVPCTGLVPLAAASPAVAGALLLRGVLLPVLDLPRWLSRGQTDLRCACVVVVVAAGRLLGLLVDGVSGVFRERLGSHQRLYSSDGSAGGPGLMVASVVRDDDGTATTVLSPEALLALPGVPHVSDPEPERAAAVEVAEAVDDHAHPSHRPYMLMRCGRITLALDALAVHTTLSDPTLAPSVLAQGACRGVTDLGGLPVPMVDLPALCGLGTLDPRRRWQAAVLRCEAGLVGLLVDAVADVVQLPVDGLLPVPGFVLRHPGLFAGVLPSTTLPDDVRQRTGIDEPQCLVLDVQALVQNPELQALAQALGSRLQPGAAEAAGAEGREPVITFEVDGEVAVRIHQVTEILPFDLVPGAYSWPQQLLGMVTQRGRCIPVMCLRQLCGLPPPAPTVDASILVVELDAQAVGFAVPRLRSIESARSAIALPRANPEADHGRQPLVSLGHGSTERLVPLIDLHERARNLMHDGRAAA